MNIPDKLFKYENISVQSLLNLKSQTVYFAPPSGFNDPYDCAIKAQIEEPSEQELANIKETYLEKSWPAHAIDELKNKSPSEFKLLLMRVAREANEIFIDNFIRDKGVSCFSEVNNDLLMWAHYANKYTGFCLEFKTNDELFEKARKVKHVDKIPKLNILGIYNEKDRADIIELFCTKSKSWEYEREWRCIHATAGTAYIYPSETLTGIYFGPNIDPHMLEIICLILQGQNPNIRFWKGRRSEYSFSVEFEEFHYTSYAMAKILGLRT